MSNEPTYQLRWETLQANYFIKQGATSQLQLRLGIVVDNTQP